MASGLPEDSPILSQSRVALSLHRTAPAADHGGHGMPLTLKKRGEIWWIRGTVRGISCQETTGTTDRTLAEEYRATREAELFRQAIHGQCATVGFARAALSYLELEERPPAQKEMHRASIRETRGQ